MKFANLKSSLTEGVKNAYYIAGKDAYLRDSAANMIRKKCVQCMPDFNVSVFNDENFDIDKVLNACKTIPMGDRFKVVEIVGVSPDKKSVEKLEKYLKAPSETTCVIIKDSINFSGYKNVAALCEKIDCDFLEEDVIKPIIASRLAKKERKIDSLAIQTLLNYTNFDMTYINLELKKLVAYTEKNQVITQEIIEKLVHKNLEYSVFELNNAVAVKDKKKAFLLLELMLESKESPQTLLMLLISNFRRFFYTSITKASDKEIASLLDVKEYSIKVARKLAVYYTPKKLKKILDLGGQIDFDVKNGKMDDVNGLYYFISNILLI